MSAPAWLAGSFAVLMIMIAVCCAARLAISRLPGRNTELDTDALHVLMGVAMAGMLEPRLTPVPVTAWRAVFAAAAAWFAWQAIRPGSRAGRARCAHPAAHAVECAAMVYMLLPVGSWPSGHGPGDGDARHEPGHHHRQPRAHPGAGALHARLRPVGHRPARPPVPDPGSRNRPRNYRAPPAPARPDRASRRGRRPIPRHRLSPTRAGSPVLAPRLAASYKIAMAITMGYMLIMML